MLAIDAGSQSVRAARFTSQGVCLEFSKQTCTQSAEQSDVEQDPRAILAAVRLCLDKLKLDGELQAAAVVSQGASALCYRRSDGAPLSSVISWQDRRGESYLREFSRSAQEVHDRTGLPLSSHYGATKLRWCLENLPDVVQAQREGDLVAAPLMGYLLYHLCQERPTAVDAGSASRTQLWNLHNQLWDAELAGEFGVPMNILPQGLGTCASFGTLNVANRQVPLVFCNRDQQAALFADGRPRENTAYVNLGTGAFIQCLLPKPCGPPELLINRVLSGPHAEEPMYSLEGTVHGAAGALPWLERHLGFPIVPELLNDALAFIPPAEKPVYFVNGVMGMGSPYWRSETLGWFSSGLTAQEKLLAWLESVCFMLVENLSILRHNSNVDRLSLSGGFSNLSGLVQRLADLSGLPCERRVDHEATLRGAAFLAAGQPTDWHPGAAMAFQPTTHPGLERRYEQWRNAMSQLT